jgi:hypothetical protein
MTEQVTYRELKPGDRIHRAMQWQTVISVGDVIPNDGRVPLVVKLEKSGREVELKIQANAKVMVFPKRKFAQS